ncbi:MAG: hypothetical protein QM743_00875 [Chitinophagaceae bacterium]
MQKFFRNTLLCLTVFCSIPGPEARAQDNAPALDKDYFRKMEDSLLVTADSIYNIMIPDFRTEQCELFVKQLIRTLKTPGSYNYPFDSLKKTINIVSSPDNKFRIFNWPLAYSDVRVRYYAAIQMNEPELKLIPLFDKTDMLSKPDPYKECTNSDWMGTLIYNIIPKETEEGTVYFILGVNNGNPISNKKMIDPMTFSGNSVRFGAPLFAMGSMESPDKPVNRFILEYKKEASVGMNWDAEYNAIVYDELASEVNDPNRKYTYIPTGQYNGLRWSNGKWRVIENLIPVMELKDGAAPDAGK